MADLVPAVIPSLDPMLSLVTNSVGSPHTRRAYGAAITDFLFWCRDGGSQVFSKSLVQQYRSTLEQRHLSASSVKVQMSAIRRLAAEMADNGLLDLQTALLISKVRGPRRNGVRTGSWLSLQQAEAFIALPDGRTIKGKTRPRSVERVAGRRVAPW